MNSSSEYFVVLGASSDQLFMIHTAKSMGLKVLAVDGDASVPGAKAADVFFNISTRDLPNIIKRLDDFKLTGGNIVGVSTMGSDIPEIVAAVAQHLGTPGIKEKDAQVAADKLLMKERLAEHGVPIPWFCEIDSYEALKEIIEERGSSLVIKPNDRSGSRGVFLLDDQSDVRDLFDKARDFSFSGRVMVEEFLPGLQISTETIMVDGRGYTRGFADRNYSLLDRFRPQIMENGGWVPSVLNPHDRAAVDGLAERASLALGVRDGSTKGDVVMTPEGPKMIEMAARLSGGDFCESLVPLGSGINYVQTVVEIASGRTPDLDALEPKFDVAVANRYFFPEAGRLLQVVGEEEVRSWDWVKKLEFWYRLGDEVPPSLSHAHRFGVFVVVAPDRDVLEERVARVYDTIRIVTEAV